MGLLTGVLSLAREPVRLSLRAWELGLSSAASVARLGLDLLEQPPAYEPTTPAAEAYPAREPYSARRRAAAQDNGAAAERDVPPAVPDALVPDHVDEEVVLVAETAEAGAEDGAGPELHIDEPWDGYRTMTAADIKTRLTAGTPELAAAVQLYEQIHKSRRTVLEAARQALGAKRRPSG